MTTKQIKEKIEAAKANIQKLCNSADNARKAITKANDEISTNGWDINPPTENAPNEIRYRHRDLTYIVSEKSKSYKKAFEKAQKSAETLEKLESELAKQETRDAILKNELPEEFETLKTVLVERWNEYDRVKIEKFRADYAVMTHKEIKGKYGWNRDEYFMNESEIMAENTKSAQAFVIDLFFRVREVTGTVKEFKYISVDGPALNGLVIGENGTARVETIVAGGYNIQRLHLRVLVKKYSK